MEPKDLGKTTTGLQPNIAALLGYALGWASGLIMFLLEKENKFVRFHAFQSIVVFGACTVLQIALMVMPVLGGALLPVLSVVQLVAWILLMVKSYQGEKFSLPVAGELADKNA